MLPLISFESPLQQFLGSEHYTANDLVLAARNYAQQQIGDQGIAFVGDVLVKLACIGDQCVLEYVRSTIVANPFQKPPLILSPEDELVAIWTDFFFNISEETVETFSMRVRQVSVTLPPWEDLPISLASAQQAFISHVQQTFVKDHPHYRMTLSLSRQGWTANFYYTDPENTRAAADETLEIPFESQP